MGFVILANQNEINLQWKYNYEMMRWIVSIPVWTSIKGGTKGKNDEPQMKEILSFYLSDLQLSESQLQKSSRGEFVKWKSGVSDREARDRRNGWVEG